MLALFHFKVGMMPTLIGCSVAGMALYLVGGSTAAAAEPTVLEFESNLVPALRSTGTHPACGHHGGPAPGQRRADFPRAMPYDGPMGTISSGCWIW
jgi:hypothetical protein